MNIIQQAKEILPYELEETNHPVFKLENEEVGVIIDTVEGELSGQNIAEFVKHINKNGDKEKVVIFSTNQLDHGAFNGLNKAFEIYDEQ